MAHPHLLIDVSHLSKNSSRIILRELYTVQLVQFWKDSEKSESSSILVKNWYCNIYPISREKPNFLVIWSFTGNYVKSEKPSSVLLSSLSASTLPLRILHQWDAQIESLWQAPASESSYPLILQIQCYYIYVRLLLTECTIRNIPPESRGYKEKMYFKRH